MPAPAGPAPPQGAPGNSWPTPNRWSGDARRAAYSGEAPAPALNASRNRPSPTTATCWHQARTGAEELRYPLDEFVDVRAALGPGSRERRILKTRGPKRTRRPTPGAAAHRSAGACGRLNFKHGDDIVVPRLRPEEDVFPHSRGCRPLTDRVDSDGVWA